MIRHGFRPAHRAEKDRVMPADLLLPVFRHHPVMASVIITIGEIEIIELQIEIIFFRRRFQHAYALGHNLLADPVSGDHRDTIGIGLSGTD